MVHLTPSHGDWSEDLIPEGWATETITLHENEDTRISALLGPDGEPLVIRRRRHRIGFDLVRQPY